MTTLPTEMFSPGTFATNRSEMPSCGWMRSVSTAGWSTLPAASSLNRTSGTDLKWIATSVSRSARRLPARR